MDWILSPLGIGSMSAIVVVIASLVYWKRDLLKKWWRGRKVNVTLKAGPMEVSLSEKDKPDRQEARAGVDFGQGSDFTGARISGVAGRDIHHADSAGSAPGGQTPGVDFGEKNKFGHAAIKGVAGRDAED